MLLKSKEAIEDIDNIWFRIAIDKPSAADAFVFQIEEKLKTLEITPLIGPVFNPESIKYKKMRYFPIGKYLIFYYPIADGIKVYRILHGAMDFNAVFDK